MYVLTIATVEDTEARALELHFEHTGHFRKTRDVACERREVGRSKFRRKHEESWAGHGNGSYRNDEGIATLEEWVSVAGRSWGEWESQVSQERSGK